MVAASWLSLLWLSLQNTTDKVASTTGIPFLTGLEAGKSMVPCNELKMTTFSLSLQVVFSLQRGKGTTLILLTRNPFMRSRALALMSFLCLKMSPQAHSEMLNLIKLIIKAKKKITDMMKNAAIHTHL